MHLCDFPPELAQRMFQEMVFSRELKRVMRLRLVCRMFKQFIDDAIFRLHLLHDIPGQESWVTNVQRETTYPEWHSYVFQYMAYHAWIERDPKTYLGRIRRVAVILSEEAGDAEQPAVMVRLQSLCRLAACNRSAPGDRYHLFRSKAPNFVFMHDDPWCSDEALNDDLCVAAAYLGCRPHIEKAISQHRLLCPWEQSTEVSSIVFGGIYDAAVFKGEMSMVRLLLSSAPDYNPSAPLNRRARRRTLELAAAYGHRDAYDFAFYSGPKLRYIIRDCKVLRFPDQYKRTASKYLNNGIDLLRKKAADGHLDMVKYLLDQGISPNHKHGKSAGLFGQCFQPLVNAVKKGDLAIVKLLLERGADPNWFHVTNSALTMAARFNRLLVAETLLEAGTDVNEGLPPPVVLAVLKEDMDMFRLLRRYGARLDTPESGGWAMALARLHELESMVDVLEQEGVERDMILHRCATDDEEQYNDVYLYAWPSRKLEEHSEEDYEEDSEEDY